jgi:tetratricopeptide (TPR) repeat protein
VIDNASLLQQLRAAESPEERSAILAEHAPLDTSFFQLVKEKSLEVARSDNQKALRIAEIGIEASEFTTAQEGRAYAWWAKGNALLFLLQWDDCLAAYSTAISIFASLNRVQEVAQLQTNCMPPLMYQGRHAEAQAMGRSALETLGTQEDSPSTANLLLNLGVCAQEQGHYEEALRRVEQATGIFSRLENTLQASRCQVTQALVLEGLDRFAEAKDLLHSALRTFAAQDAWMPWGRAALNLGVLSARLADYQAALHQLEEARHGFERAGNEMEIAVVDLYRTQCFLDVNLLPEASALAERLVETFTQLKMPRQVARTATLLAEVYERRGQAALARRELDRARRVFRSQGDTIEVALLDLRRAELMQGIGRSGEALRLASQASQALDVCHHPLRHAEAHLIVAACCEDLGRIEEAQVAYQVAWEAGGHPTSTTVPPPMLAYRIAYARGAIAEAAGQRSLARGEYGRAIEHLGRIARGLGLDELRGGYLQDRRPVYEAAMRLALDDGRLADAFRYSELARAGTLRDLLARGHHLAIKSKDDDLTALESLKARWAWRVTDLRRPVDLMAEAEEDVSKPADRATQLRELADLERNLTDAYRRRRLLDPRFAVMEQGEVLALDDVRRQLPDDVALLSFDHVDSRLLAFVITHDNADIVHLGGMAELQWEVAGLSHALDEIYLFDDASDLALVEKDLVEDLQALYRAVLAKPLARIGPEIQRLIIVPCSPMHALPLEALHDGNAYLMERYAVCHLPSTSLLAALPGSRRADGHPALVMAHSGAQRLPLALKEAKDVARTLTSDFGREAILKTEEQATARVLREQVGDAGVVHIATHGTFRADAPLFSSLHLADGPLTVNEVYDLDLSQAALVTLSGCRTGIGKGLGGEMLGLLHAFFFAGAPTLVVSRWRVEDEATAQLMQDFYATLGQGKSTAEALRTAQLGTAAYRPHAGYWAAFSAWGQGFEPVFLDDGGEMA